jgi:hypothetical protein
VAIRGEHLASGLRGGLEVVRFDGEDQELGLAEIGRVVGCAWLDAEVAEIRAAYAQAVPSHRFEVGAAREIGDFVVRLLEQRAVEATRATGANDSDSHGWKSTGDCRP